MSKLSKFGVALAMLALIAPVNAQEKVFTESSQDPTRTNVTLTAANIPVKLFGVASGTAQARIISTVNAYQIRAYPSTSATASAAVTNALTSGLGCLFIGSNANPTLSSSITMGRNAALPLWTKYVYVASPDGTGTVHGIEFVK